MWFDLFDYVRLWLAEYTSGQSARGLAHSRRWREASRPQFREASWSAAALRRFPFANRPTLNQLPSPVSVFAGLPSTLRFDAASRRDETARQESANFVSCGRWTEFFHEDVSICVKLATICFGKERRKHKGRTSRGGARRSSALDQNPFR
jgi:hypothetical protein